MTNLQYLGRHGGDKEAKRAGRGGGGELQGYGDNRGDTASGVSVDYFARRCNAQQLMSLFELVSLYFCSDSY